MAKLYQLIENLLGIAAHKEEEADKSAVPAGVFIEEPTIYEDLADTDTYHSESIEKEYLMPAIE